MILTMASSEKDIFDSLGTLKVAQNTTGLQVKPDKCMNCIVWFLAVEAEDLLGHVPISSCSEVSMMVEEFIMSKTSAGPSKQSALQQKLLGFWKFWSGRRSFLIPNQAVILTEDICRRHSHQQKKLLGFFVKIYRTKQNPIPSATTNTECFYSTQTLLTTKP